MVQSDAFAYNISFYSSTEFSPFRLLYGKQLSLSPLLYNLVKDAENVSYSKYLEQLSKLLINIQTEAYSNILEKNLKAIEKLNSKQTSLQNYSPGEKVIFYSNIGYGRKGKLTTL